MAEIQSKKDKSGASALRALAAFASVIQANGEKTNALESSKLDLDREKFEFYKHTEEKKLDLEERKLRLEETKVDLEERKFELEKEKFEESVKSKKLERELILKKMEVSGEQEAEKRSTELQIELMRSISNLSHK